MVVKSVIFDFDGVLADTYQAYIDFLIITFGFSPEKAKNTLTKGSTEIAIWRSGIIQKIVGIWYYNSFRKFLKKHKPPLFIQQFSQIEQWEIPKAILTRSHQKICRDIMQEKADLFTLIFGRETTSNKVKGFKKIFNHPHFSPATTVFITDTVADVLDANQVLPPERIFAVNWGFDSEDNLISVLPKTQILQTDFSRMNELFNSFKTDNS